jgi:hypothetical protein
VLFFFLATIRGFLELFPAFSPGVLYTGLKTLEGAGWNQFAERHGGWGRDATLWLGRCAGRLRLTELGSLVGGLDYAVVSKAIARFERRRQTDLQLREQLIAVQHGLDCPNDK